MNYYRKDGKPTRHTVTKLNAILSWELRHPGATPEERAKAMAEIEKRFARRGSGQFAYPSDQGFPPAGGPTPWTPKQIRDYANQQRQKLPDAPF